MTYLTPVATTREHGEAEARIIAFAIADERARREVRPFVVRHQYGEWFAVPAHDQAYACVGSIVTRREP